MKFNHLEEFSLLLVLFLLCNSVQSETAFAGISRRVLHEPLFPGPPLVVIRFPPPPASSEHPFFNEEPPGSSSNRNPPPSQPPPPPIPHSEPQVPNKTTPLPVQVNHPTKKLAIAASVGIVTLGMLSALAFFLYRHRARHTEDEPRKIVRGNSRRDLEESRMPPPPLSDFLYIGTVEPVVSHRSVMEGENGLNESPYHRLKSIKRADRYRPSPDLQPLPPLTKQINRISSSSAMFSSDDESLDMFYTPQRNADGAFTAVPCQNYPTNDNSPAACSAPHSKRASPKSRVAVSSPDIKCTFIPPITKPPQPPLPPPVPPPRPLHVPTPRPPVKEQDTKIATSSLAPLDADDTEGGRPRLKPLHWDKVRAASDRATVWDQLNSSNFQLNEDMMETLFGCNSATSDPREARKKMGIPHVGYEIRVLDPKKSQNIAILLRALNMTMDEVSEALLDGNTEPLGVEVLETLVKMAPTKEEEIKLQEYKGSISLLGSAERFLRSILDIPFAFERVEAMLYKANFDTEVNYLRKSYKTLEAASEELKNSRLFIKLLEAVLKAGNRMNVGTNRGDARAFKLDTLLKLVDVKATDGKTTLLHFVVQELTRSEGAVSETENKNPHHTSNTQGFKKQNLEVVAGLSRDLGNVKKAAGMDSDVLHSYVYKLVTGLTKIRSVLRYEKPGMQGKFFDSMHSFIEVADKEILLIKDDEMKALSLVKEATEYFHGDHAKEEAHPLRIFMIVRDFLSILDHVCKEVGRIQDRVLVGSARSCQISTNASLPAFNRYSQNQT